jgi:hypothetical protein
MSRTKKSARRGASKRKQENNAPYHDKRAKLKDLIEKDASNSLDNVEAVLTKLMGGMSMEKFSREYFEKKPLLVRANGNNVRYLISLLYSYLIILFEVVRKRIVLSSKIIGYST